jgi:hypothetical protein
MPKKSRPPLMNSVPSCPAAPPHANTLHDHSTHGRLVTKLRPILYFVLLIQQRLLLLLPRDCLSPCLQLCGTGSVLAWTMYVFPCLVSLMCPPPPPPSMSSVPCTPGSYTVMPNCPALGPGPARPVSFIDPYRRPASWRVAQLLPGPVTTPPQLPGTAGIG